MVFVGLFLVSMQLHGVFCAYTPSKNVVVASDKDFQAKVADSEKASFVWFLAPW